MKLSKSTEAESTPRVTGSASFLKGWRIAGISATGEDHLHGKDPMPCQDAFLYGRVGGFVWGAVADGVGSESHSQYGARVAVEAIGDLLVNCPLEILAPDRTGFHAEAAAKVAGYCRDRIVQAADSLGLDDRTLATTLQALILDEVRGRLLYVSVGDGNCLVLRKDGAVEVLGYGRPKPGLETPSLGFEKHLAYAFGEVLDLAAVDGCMLISDGLDRMFVRRQQQSGVEAAARENVQAMADKLRQVGSEIDGVASFGKAIMTPTFRDEMRDDKTMLIIVKTDEAPVAGVVTPVQTPWPEGVEAGARNESAERPPPRSTDNPPKPVVPRSSRTRRRRALGELTLVIVAVILVLQIAQLSVALLQRGSASGAAPTTNAARPAENEIKGNASREEQNGADETDREDGAASERTEAAPTPPDEVAGERPRTSAVRRAADQTGTPPPPRSGQPSNTSTAQPKTEAPAAPQTPPSDDEE